MASKDKKTKLWKFDPDDPAKGLTHQQRRWCDYHIIYGYNGADSTREVYPKLKKNEIYTKAASLKRNVKVVAYLDWLVQDSFKEPERILQIFLRTSRRIGRDEDSRQWNGAFNTIAKLSGRLDRLDEIPDQPDINIKITFED